MFGLSCEISTITIEPLSALRTRSAPSTDWTLPSTRAHCLRSPDGPFAFVGALGEGTGGATTGVAGGAEGATVGGGVGAGGVAMTVGAAAGAGGVETTVDAAGAGGAGGVTAGGGVAATVDVAVAAGAGAAGGAAAGAGGGATTAGAGGGTTGVVVDTTGAAAAAGAGAAGGGVAAGVPPCESARASDAASPAPMTIAVTSCGRAPSRISSATRPPTFTSSEPWRRAPATSAEYTRPSSPRTMITGSPVSAAGHSTVPCRNRGSPGAANAGNVRKSETQRPISRRVIRHLRSRPSARPVPRRKSAAGRMSRPPSARPSEEPSSRFWEFSYPAPPQSAADGTHRPRYGK